MTMVWRFCGQIYRMRLSEFHMSGLEPIISFTRSVIVESSAETSAEIFRSAAGRFQPTSSGLRHEEHL